LKHVGKVFLCATRLHNFCINEKKILSMQEENEEGSGEDDPTRSDSDDVDNSVDHHNDDRRARPRRRHGDPGGAATMPVDNGFIPSSVDVVAVRGNSMMRDILLEKISSDALTRPAHNIRRNRRQQEEQEQEHNND
jgi:hypothetical protein